MTIDEAARVTNPDGIAFREKLDRYVNYLGRENIRKYLPAKPAELAREWLADENFNKMPLSRWDHAAGYPGYKDRQGYVPPDGSGSFQRFLRSKGITGMQVSTSVSILKHAAELEARDYLAEMLASRPGHEKQDLEIWAVFEHCSARTDKANRYNIFDFDCTAAFRDEGAAMRYEQDNPGRRVRKLVRIRNVSIRDLLAPAGNKDNNEEDGNDA